MLIAAGLVSGAGGEPRPRVAEAAVTPVSGYSATVAGWTSWYGAYGLADLGWAWCIDHGSAAPDPDFIYAPTSIAHETDADTRAAMAWAVTMNPHHDPVTAAAIMLVLHDLRGATYPFGPLDLERLGASDLDGFDGAEQAVLEWARAIEADARSHAHLRHPYTLDVAVDRAAPGTDGAIRARLTDANGAPVHEVAVTIEASGASLLSDTVGRTAADGTVWFGFRAGEGENHIAAQADLPGSEPLVFAPTTQPAQRVIVPAWSSVRGADAFVPTPPTTSPPTTTPPTTTPPTTAPPPTSTPPTTTTTIAPPPTTTTTTPAPAPTSTTTTSTTAAPTTTTTVTPTTTIEPPSTATPPTTAAPPPPAPPSPGPVPVPSGAGSRPATTTLPRTGLPVGPWVLIAAGLVLCGIALRGASRHREAEGPERTGTPRSRPIRSGPKQGPRWVGQLLRSRRVSGP